MENKKIKPEKVEKLKGEYNARTTGKSGSN